MAKIVLTLLDGKVLTRDNKVIGSESGCCCCFCSETCERCIITDVEFTGLTPPVYQALDKTAYAPDPPFCTEMKLLASKTTAEWAECQSYYNPYSGQTTVYCNSDLVLNLGDYAEEITTNGTRLYKVGTLTYVEDLLHNTWADRSYSTLPDGNFFTSYQNPISFSGDFEDTREQLYLFCLKGDGTDGPFANIGTFFKDPDTLVITEGPRTPKKIFNIDIDLHECGWVFVIQRTTCQGPSIDHDTSCSMNFARIPSDDTGCPKIGNYNTVATFASPAEIAAKELGAYEIADCAERRNPDPVYQRGIKFSPPGKTEWLKISDFSRPTWPRTQGVIIERSRTTAEWEADNQNTLGPNYYEERLANGERKYKTGAGMFYPTWSQQTQYVELPIVPQTCGDTTYQWGARCIPYKIWVRKTLRTTTSLCCIPGDPGFYYYFISQGPWTTLSNWRVINSVDPVETGCPGGLECGGYCEDDLPEYYCTKWLSGGVVPTMLPGPFDRVVIQESVTIPSDTKVLSMHVVGSVVPNAPKISIAGTISTTDFSLFSHSAELTGQLLGKGKIIFAQDSIVSSVGIIGHATKNNDFTLIKFKNSSINNGKTYNRFCNIDGQTNVIMSIQRFVEFHDTSSNAAVGSVNYTPAKFYGSSTNKGIICKDFGKGASTNMNTLVENEGYPRSFFYDQSTNIAGATVVGAASFYNLAQNLGTINNAIDPYADKSINSAKFYGLVIGNAGGANSANGETGEILGYADFYDNSANYGDVIKDLTLHDVSACGYRPGNDEDAINVGGDLIMRDFSGLSGAKIKIVGSLTTGTLGSLDESPKIINSNIEVANNTNLYSNTVVLDSQILCTTDNKTMTINDTSVIALLSPLNPKTIIKYAIVIFNDNADNSGKIIPYSSPNTTTFNDSSINRSEDIVGVLTFNDDSRNVVESDLVATYISVTFNDDSANMKNLFAFDPELCSPSFDSELCSPSSSSSSSP